MAQVDGEEVSDAGSCPSCALRDVDTTLKGIPVLLAYEDGLVVIGPRSDRELLANMLYVICPVCLWYGFTERS